ncbi:MAG: Regulatory protein ArsR [Cyanobacteria bacterium RYN_339]|nr:Regulatory protein ArsR [Cyanobacteria bacterium RYN_339]
MPNHHAVRTFKAEFFKALAHPLRIHVLDALRDGERSVGELRDLLEVEMPNVSQQLSILRAKNLVVTRKDGNTVYYSVADPAVFRLLDVAKEIFGNQLVGVQGMLQTLSES